MVNLRENITRTIKYSIVTITKPYIENENIIIKQYTVYGATNEKKEMLKYLKENDGNVIPKITVTIREERRTMTLDNFLDNSIIINESEEN